jgi:hypothetical protein
MGHEEGNTKYTKGEYIKTTYTILLGYILMSKGYLKDEVIRAKVDYLKGYTRTTNGG